MTRNTVMNRRSQLVLAVGAVLLLGACASQPTSQAGQVAPGQPGASGAPASPPLQIGLITEPTALGGKFGSDSGTADFHFLFAAQLVQYDALGNPQPVLAAAVPSLSDGTWTVTPDGQMETIYTLRPGATWQDGVPFTADDVVFTWQSVLNRQLGATKLEPEKFIDRIDVVDPTTLRVHWSATYPFANAWPLEPIPQHILGPLAM